MMKPSFFTAFVVATFSLVEARPAVTRVSDTIQKNTGSLSRRDAIMLQNYHLPADNDGVQSLTAALADTMELVGKLVDAAAWNTPTFGLYFPPEARDGVASLFQKMHAGNPRGAEVTSQVVFDNNDSPDGQDPEHRPICLANSVAAYTRNGDPHPRIHVCPSMWKIPRLRDIAESVCKGSQMSNR
ncbi:MAG: hypothetical protein L6R35_001116 [Caloplaca aegaea]|nr:MAG: hypothetical protein L6R35_001116 [Caloplaca aegaea]